MRSMMGLAVVLAAGLSFVGAKARAGDDAVVPCCCVNLDDVRSQPQSWLWTKFCFEGRFARLSEIYQPFFTRFDAYDYANFTAWDARRDTSVQSDFMNSYPLLYVDRRAGSAIENLFCLKQFQRFRATGVVQNIFDGKPFIEIIDIVPIDTCCCCGSTLSHLLVPHSSHCCGDPNAHPERRADTASVNMDASKTSAAAAPAQAPTAEASPAQSNSESSTTSASEEGAPIVTPVNAPPESADAAPKSESPAESPATGG